MAIESELLFNDTSWSELDGFVEKAARGPSCPASQVGNRLLHTAIREQASDQLLSRVKVIAHLPTHKRDAGLEGRFTLSCDGSTIDLRVSFLSTLRGERLAMRVLDRRNLFRGWSELGPPEPHAIAHVPWAPRWRGGAACRGRTAVAEWIGPDEVPRVFGSRALG